MQSCSAAGASIQRSAGDPGNVSDTNVSFTNITAVNTALVIDTNCDVILRSHQSLWCNFQHQKTSFCSLNGRAALPDCFLCSFTIKASQLHPPCLAPNTEALRVKCPHCHFLKGIITTFTLLPLKLVGCVFPADCLLLPIHSLYLWFLYCSSCSGASL